jgi:thiamine biosynthesis lipoprotein
MNRRDFFDPRQLAHGAGQVIGAVEALRSGRKVERREEMTLVRASRHAMATTFDVVLPFGTADGLTAAEAALDEIDRLEDQLTVYREHSEVSRLNHLASAQPVPVEENLFGLLQLAARLSRETEGAFDITAAPLIKAWGFYRRCHRLPTGKERAEILTRVGMKHVILDPEQRTVRYLQPGIEINLGSIGKGYALDRVVLSLQTRWNLRAGLLNGGHSSVYAIGSEPGEQRGWAVGIRHPWDAERRLAVVRLRDQALATSGATFQHLQYAGRRLGHILDPRTGWPPEEMASATVIAPTGAEADALATAFFVLGVEKARAYCDIHPGIGAVLLPAGDHASPVVVGLEADVVELGEW